MEEKILKILQEHPTFSNREIGKLIGLSRSSIQYYMNKLNIHRDRKEMQKANNTCRVKTIVISPLAEQIILGSILGDGYMSPNRHPGNTHLTLNSELRIAHGLFQEEYIKYKKTLLEKEGIRCHLSFIDASKCKVHYINGIKVKENGRYCLRTQRNVVFNFYRDLFYKPHKKINKYLYKLGPLGLAIWYMDDGFRNGNGFKLATEGFTLKEVNFLRKILKHNFELETTVQYTRMHKPQIYIKTSCRKKFIELVFPYVCESMRYKLAL